MNTLAVQRQSLLPELSGLFAGLRPLFGGHPIRVEDELTDGHFEVRAELPGVDPAEDVEVTVRRGRLTIRASRTRASEPNGRSEFLYGSFVRTIALPDGAVAADVTAVYDRGILTVAVPVVGTGNDGTRVEIVEIADGTGVEVVEIVDDEGGSDDRDAHGDDVETDVEDDVPADDEASGTYPQVDAQDDPDQPRSGD